MIRRPYAVLATLALLACQRGRDEAVERVVEHAIAARGREAKVTIDREQGSITVDLGGAVKPSDWPSAVPLYPHASRAKIEKSDGAAQRLAITTDDSVGDVGGFYRRELARLGWQVVDDNAERRWSARRGSEHLELEFSSRGANRETRAVIEYRTGGRG